LKPFPADLKARFYSAYGGENDFAKTTASPVLGSLNSGMILYLLRHGKPEVFKRIRQSLHLPQYVSSLFTSVYCSDLTSIGCHTNLWDFHANDYHRWVAEEGVDAKLAPIRHSDSALIIEVHGNKLYSGTGLHDSSSALIPYLMHSDEPFILLSTGTWCISLNPFNDSPLTIGELGQDCLCYLTYEGRPVKASRLFLGHIHDEKCAELVKRFDVGEDAYKSVEYLPDAGSKPGSFEEAYNKLVRELVEQQIRSTNLVMQDGIKAIYVDGGFSQNKIFMTLLSNAYPKLKIFAASVTQASALGAALVIHDDWNSRPIRRDLLKLTSFQGSADTR
jgi:sugar (pentulose or hexulose) kinase